MTQYSTERIGIKMKYVQLTAAAGRCKLPAVLGQSVTHFCEDSILLQEEALEGLAQPCRSCLLILYLLEIVALDVIIDILGLCLIQIQVEVRQIVVECLHRQQSGIAEEDLLVGVLQQAPVVSFFSMKNPPMNIVMTIMLII